MTNSSAQEDLAYIKQIMLDSRRIVCDDGMNFLFWGMVVVIGQILTFLKIYFTWEVSLAWLWPVLIGTGWIFTIVYEWRRGKRARIKSFAGKILASVWIASGIAMTTVGFVGTVSGAYKGVFVNPLICCILGVAYFVSGAVYGRKWVSLLSIGWWLGAITMFIWPYLYTLLLMATMMVILQTIPGFILYKASKRELKEAV